jgi:sugar phosphate isomerase/epimerase
VHGPIWELYTASIYPEIRHLAVDMVKRAIDFAVKIEAVHITLHPGLRRWPDVWPQLETAALNAQLASFEELCNYATRSGVLVGIENMPRSKDQFGGYVDFSELERVLDALPDVGVTLDVGHVQTAGLDPGTVIHHLGERINHLHVHDNWGEHDEHLPVGDGEIAWAPLCEALVTTGYQGVLEIERSLADGGVCASLQRIKSYLPSHPIPKEKNRS